MTEEKLKLEEKEYLKISDELKSSGLTEKEIESILGDNYKVFNDESELGNLSSKGNNFVKILGELQDGYTIDELQGRGISKQDIDSFKTRLEECNLSVENAIAINKYSNGSNMILGIKKGTTSKEKIADDIFLDLKEKLDLRGMDPKNFDSIQKAIQELDYNKTLHENYEEFKNVIEKLDIPKNCVTPMNNTIRNVNSLEHIDETIEQLDDALSKARLPESMKVYRALKNNPNMNLENLNGNMVENVGYTSTSPIYDSSFAKYDEYGTVLELYLPKGTKGVYIDEFSDYEGTEQEVLLDANDVVYTDLSTGVVDKNGRTKNILKGVVLSKGRECYKETIKEQEVNKEGQGVVENKTLNSENISSQSNLPYKQNKFSKFLNKIRGKVIGNKSKNVTEKNNDNFNLNNDKIDEQDSMKEVNEFKKSLKDQTCSMEEIAQNEIEANENPVIEQPQQQMQEPGEMII